MMQDIQSSSARAPLLSVENLVVEYVVGSRIVAVTKLDYEPMVETPSAAAFCVLLAGREVRSVGRRAKWIVVQLDAGWTLALHLRMSGSLTVHGPDYEPDSYTHLVLRLEDERQVFFHDPRKFGRVRLLDAAGLAALDTAHGVEPLAREFTPERLAGLLRGRGRAIRNWWSLRRAIGSCPTITSRRSRGGFLASTAGSASPLEK